MKDLIDFIVLIMIYFYFFFKKWSLEGGDKLFIKTIMYIYLSLVLYVTLMPVVVSIPFIFNHPYIPMNMIPFIDVMNNRGDFVRQVVLNVVMTIPFGFLLPLVRDGKTNILKVFLYSFLLSFSIEVLQPLINGCRTSDITDIMTNVIGGIIGYLIYLVFRPIILKILNYLKNDS